MIDFTWKNEKASDHGIIVQSLAPITKAPERTEVIEIEGRDGDIIISNGFSAYDKQVNIGLSKNYDLNWLINWLQGKGQVIFSNEDTVFYNAQIINQIDFKKLLAFKTATITFHVQPYKYLVNEEIINSTSKTITVNNKGIVESKPIITITGTGQVDVSINGSQCCVLELNDTEDSITIDSIEEEAYTDNLITLRNRNMIGSFPTLISGDNEITLTGEVTNIKVEVKSRWL